MGTLVVGAIVASVVVLAARKIYKDRKNGKSCGCESCSSCPGCADNGGSKTP